MRRTPTVLLAVFLLTLGLAPAAAAPRPAFSAQVRPIDDALAARMQWSWRPGCPVPLAGLRYVTLTYVGFDGAPHTGELVVRRRLAGDVVTAFHRLYDLGFPIRRMRLVDDYRGDDDASMRANNTSAFNCRPVTGGTGWSQHSYGRAVDINPVQNPYVTRRTVAPPAGSRYLDRGRLRRGMLTVAARRAFTDLGWGWGGSWRSLQDYMHLSSNNR
jgi:D-alanyl-D-alanine carboxypeptidase-like protein